MIQGISRGFDASVSQQSSRSIIYGMDWPRSAPGKTNECHNILPYKRVEKNRFFKTNGQLFWFFCDIVCRTFSRSVEVQLRFYYLKI